MNNPFSRIPGLSLAQGLQAGYQAAGTGLQNVDTINKLSEWKKNAALRDLTRQAATDQLRTSIPLNAAANKTLLEIQKLRPLLYSRPDGYLQVLNQISPVGQGMTRRVSADGKTIETIDPIGAVVSTTPNFTGRAAENALLNAGGISLIDRAKGLPAQEQADAHNQTQLMTERIKAQSAYDVAELGLRSARLMAGAGGGRGGKGAGVDGNPQFSAEEYTKLLNNLIWQLDMSTPGSKLPYDSKTGHVDMGQVTMNPEQVTRLAQLTDAANRRLAAGVGQGAQPVYGAMAGVLDHNNQITKANIEQARKAQEAAAEEARRRSENLELPTSGSAKPTGTEWYNRNGRELTKDLLGGVAKLFDTSVPQDVSQFAPGLGTVQRQSSSPELARMGARILDNLPIVDPNSFD